MQKKVDGWRRHASDLRSQAERTNDPVQKETLVKLAKGWEEMAASRELIISLGGRVADPED
jgi:hypothetical protein